MIIRAIEEKENNNNNKNPREYKGSLGESKNNKNTQ
jgi:hypothetical protein